jgi:hypothetical protein
MTKALILDEALPGKKGRAYCQFRAIEVDLSDEDCKFFDSIHGIDLTNPDPDSKEDLLLERYLNFLYDFSKEKSELRHKLVINTDFIESKKNMGPYDRVFHIVY